MEVRRTADGIEIPPPSPNDVLYEKRDGFARIVLNRPTVLNALNKNSHRLLAAALDRAEADDEVRAVILTGAGRAFCAGGDLHAALYPDNDPAPSAMENMLRIWSFPKPVIAAVRGHAVGQGVELAGVCDMTIATEDAKFGEIQIRNGSAPPVLITPFLVGLKKAKELLLLGELVDAYEAQRIGLVNRVVPNDQLEAESEQMARKLASLPHGAVRLNKALVNRVYALAALHEALAYRNDPAIAALLAQLEDDARVREQRRVMREQGWGAFRQQRDALYRETPAGPESRSS
jgi:enoyl-CoA hydratase/carnithine racemase